MSISSPSLPPDRRLPTAFLTPRRLITIAFVLLVFVAWQLYSAHMPPVLIPSPARVWDRFVELWTDPRNLAYAISSLIHVTVSVVLAFVLGVAIALLGYYFNVLDLAIYSRLTPFLNSFSSIGWAFLAMIWFGVNEGSVIFATTIVLLPFAIINAGTGLGELDREVVEMGRSFGRGAFRQTFWIILPMMFPYLFATIRLCFGIGWQVVLTAELLCGSSGLGMLINLARQRYWTDMVFAVAALILLVVYLTDRVIFAAIQQRLRRRYELS
ncbi:ABC transporter permease subunit [Methylocella sp. CPCC 101449]|uniref:ABC transporter permease n=1 Tax=Methylocella sp. CPCC 101449 TaxID=2987531 RepID=UPI0028903B8F|nr:ABC transporter permease subunit [Methylocella sp. CPCC 101449]MDT2021287.1 ABC transporter permease subunit [Methylocella sp. CPCC 101449]